MRLLLTLPCRGSPFRIARLKVENGVWRRALGVRAFVGGQDKSRGARYVVVWHSVICSKRSAERGRNGEKPTKARASAFSKKATKFSVTSTDTASSPPTTSRAPVLRTNGRDRMLEEETEKGKEPRQGGLRNEEV